MKRTGRPLKFDREYALDRVMHDIWRDGYEANSVKAISERLGITRSSFYNSFGSREALFEDVLTRYFEQAPDKDLAHLPEGMTVRALITRVFKNICAYLGNDIEGKGCLAVNCVSELCNTNPVLGPKLATLMRQRMSRFEQLLRIAVANGELPEGTAIDPLALSLKAQMVGLNTLSKVVRYEEELWAAAKTTLMALGLYDEQAVDQSLQTINA
jgi:TetR/AcrR family transcriptional repressor of nem operon